MLSSLRDLFMAPQDRSDADPTDTESRLELAGAALLVEVIRADYEMDEREFASIAEVLRADSGRNEADVEELLALARQESGDAISLYEFTSLINEHCNYAEKCVLIGNMWRIAYADSQLSKYEDHLIRKVCDLIYVSHSDFIRTKLAEKSRQQDQR